MNNSWLRTIALLLFYSFWSSNTFVIGGNKYNNSRVLRQLYEEILIRKAIVNGNICKMFSEEIFLISEKSQKQGFPKKHFYRYVCCESFIQKKLKSQKHKTLVRNPCILDRKFKDLVMLTENILYLGIVNQGGLITFISKYVLYFKLAHPYIFSIVMHRPCYRLIHI